MARGLKREPAAQDIMEIFEFAYNESYSDLQRLEDLQQMYDNTVNESAWPTSSKMPIPLLFTMVEKSLPGVMDYLFPVNKFVRLNPMEPGISMDNISKSEWALQYTLKSRMKVARYALRSIKDCYKLSVGYGIVEPIVVTPPAVVVNKIVKGGKVIANSRMIGMGQPKVTLRYRYLTPGQIIVTPDGSDFNGPGSVSWSFFIDTYSEDEFRDMYKTQPTDGEKPILKGDVEEIIKEARSLSFDARTAIVDVVAALGGVDLQRTNKPNKKIPVSIPVVKAYSTHKHVWIANGTRVIFDQSDKYQNLRTPLVKASAWPDGERWYPMSVAEAAQKMAIGVNVWMNAIFDLMTYAVKPTMIYDSTKTKGGKPPERGPNADIGVGGPVRDSAQYLQPPQMPDGMFTIGDKLQQMYSQVIGQELDAVQPGMMRAGAFSFESLLQSMTGRQKMGSTILETGFLEPIVEQTLIYMQSNIGPEGETFAMRDWNPEDGKEYIKEMSLTEQDLVNAYEIELDLKAKHENSAIDQQQRLADFNAFKDDDYIDQYELRLQTLDDDSKARRMLPSREQAREIQAQKRQIAMMQAAAEGQQGAPAVPGRQEMALAGAARVGGGL